MNKNLSLISSSFLAKFNPEEFYEIAAEIPAVEVRDPSTNISINGAQFLIPTSSFTNLINDLNIEALAEHEQGQSNIYSLPNQNESTAISNIPSTEPFPGSFNFKLEIDSSGEKNLKKNISWTYSKTFDKLYCTPGVACPIKIKVDNMPPNGTVVRATAVYAKPEHVQSIIKQCANHQRKMQFEDGEKVPASAETHLVRCRHPKAEYQENKVTHRDSVVVPFEKPPIGSQFTTLLFKFMCFSSCFGGSQKPVKIIISLEFNDQILGRQAFEIKVCASPGRDRNTEEAKLQKKSPKEDKKVTQMALPERRSSEIPMMSTRSMSRKTSASSDDNEVFTLQIRGKRNYEILRYMRDAFDAYTAISKLKKIVSSSDESVTSSNLSFKRKESFSRNSEASISLEQFLENIEMCAYYNLIVSKGIKDYDDLLSASKEKITSLKIGQSDTRILWASIQTAKMNRPDTSIGTPSPQGPKEKKLRTKKSMQPPQPPTQQPPASKVEPSFINDSFFTESFFDVIKARDKT